MLSYPPSSTAQSSAPNLPSPIFGHPDTGELISLGYIWHNYTTQHQHFTTPCIKPLPLTRANTPKRAAPLFFCLFLSVRNFQTEKGFSREDREMGITKDHATGDVSCMFEGMKSCIGQLWIYRYVEGEEITPASASIAGLWLVKAGRRTSTNSYDSETPADDKA